MTRECLQEREEIRDTENSKESCSTARQHPPPGGPISRHPYRVVLPLSEPAVLCSQKPSLPIQWSWPGEGGQAHFVPSGGMGGRFPPCGLEAPPD